MESIGRVLACASGPRSGKSWLLSLKALLAGVSCLIMNWMGWSVEGVPECDAMRAFRAETLPEPSFPRKRVWGFAIDARRRDKVGEGFCPDPKQGRVEMVCEM